MKQIKAWRSAALLFLGTLAFLLITPQLLVLPEQSNLKIHFLDVGQGDAVLIQTPDGYEALIDGGPTRGVLREVSAHQSWWDRDIELVLVTHADSDHVGGLVDILEYYDVDLIVETEAEGTSPADAAFSKAVMSENATVAFARAGQVIQLGASTTIEILAPKTNTKNWRTNTASVILKVVYGDTSILLTGDAPASIEDYLVKVYGTDLKADILKLGHHGSKTSTSELFLDTVQPQYAVVSASVGNQYGHPHQAVMQRVFARDIMTFHTGIDGAITFYSDGKNVWRQ